MARPPASPPDLPKDAPYRPAPSLAASPYRALSGYAIRFVETLADAFDDASSLGRHRRWMERHTFLKGRPYSFKNHEFQHAITDSTAFSQCVMKPSQCGESERGQRQMLAFLAIEHASSALFLLPTIRKSQRIVKSRIDLIVQGSPALSEALVAGGDSASYKQFGMSRMFADGTFGAAVISDDVDWLFIDEYDFCNQEALVTANSRLQHSRFVDPRTGLRGIRRYACTPTVPGYGIDQLYQSSNQLVYMAKCPHCNEWFHPQYLKHVRIPDYDGVLEELTPAAVNKLDEAGALRDASVFCPAPRCRRPMDLAALSPDTRREWVAAHPSRSFEGFSVSPLDLPVYHSPASITRQLPLYRGRTNHYHNFVLGLPYADAANSIIDAAVESAILLPPVTPAHAVHSPPAYTVAGLDVGLVSHLVIGVPSPTSSLEGPDFIDVIWIERIRIPAADAADTLKTVVLERLAQYNCRCLVMDQRPFIPTANAIRAARPPGWCWPANYELSDTATREFELDTKRLSLKLSRTQSLNDTVKRINAGQFRFPALVEEMDEARRHFQGTKRVDKLDDEGNTVSQWVTTGDDHYAHSMNYLNMAAKQISVSVQASACPVPSIASALVGSRAPLPT